MICAGEKKEKGRAVRRPVLLDEAIRHMLSILKHGKVTLAALGALASAQTSGVFAADIAAGRKKATQCIVCHGQNGIAVNPEAPNLAGESTIYIEKQLSAFKTGARQHEVMSIIAKDLSAEDIRNLAAWYAAMTVSVTLPKLE